MIGGDTPTAIANLMRRFLMKSIAAQLDRYIHAHPLNLGDDEFETVLDQLYQAYAESHETDPPGVAEGFKELENFLCTLPLKENNAVFNTPIYQRIYKAKKETIVRIMLASTNLLMHTIVPVIAILSFLFINTYHTIKFKATIFAVIPVVLYAMCYFVMAILIGEENGGWRDHHHFLELMPWQYTLVIILVLTFGLANLWRFVHNRMHQRDNRVCARSAVVMTVVRI